MNHWRATKAYLRSWLPSFYYRRQQQQHPNTTATSDIMFECAACGASGPTALFEDLSSGESICTCCGTVHNQEVGLIDCAEQTMTDSQYHHHPILPLPPPATSPAATHHEQHQHHRPVDDVISETERELLSAANPTMLPHVTADEKKAFGCAYRMFDKAFDVIAKRCDIKEGLANRRSLVAMRSACERVGVMHPEFSLTHDPGVQAVAAYVVATHPPGVDRGRTRLLKEADEECGLQSICNELEVTLSAVAKCVRNHGDRLYTAMRSARRIGILPELDPGGHLALEAKRRVDIRMSSLTNPGSIRSKRRKNNRKGIKF